MTDDSLVRGVRVPVTEGIFFGSLDDLKRIHLRGNHCLACDETTFGSSIHCPKCGGSKLQDVALSDSGTLYTFTVVRYPPPGNYHLKDSFEPFGLGLIEHEQGVRVMAPLKAKVDDLKIGMRMAFEPFVLRIDEQAREIVGFSYRSDK